jgi:ketosteroid isomerase-like protein
MKTQQIADRLVELCRAGEYERCYDELYADEAESIEMPAMAASPIGNARGLAAIKAKGKAWSDGVDTVHDANVGAPQVAGNWFCVPMSLDATFKDGRRVQMEELCVYQVKNGRIVREQFFYDT